MNRYVSQDIWVNRIVPRSYLRVVGAGSQDASKSIGRAEISEIVT